MGWVDLDQWSKDILWQVCHAGPYYSSVLIAIDLDDLGKLTNRMDAVDLIQMSLTALNEFGLVIYSEAAHGIFTRVRATPDGYDAAGFPPPMKIVGAAHSYGSNASDHPGDGTDWRNHTWHAEGGPIERMPLRQHIFTYWDHAELHFEALWELEGRPHADDPQVRSVGHQDGRQGPHVHHGGDHAGDAPAEGLDQGDHHGGHEGGHRWVPQPCL